MFYIIGQKWAKRNKLPKEKRQERIFPNSEEAFQATEALPYFASPLEAAAGLDKWPWAALVSELTNNSD